MPALSAFADPATATASLCEAGLNASAAGRLVAAGCSANERCVAFFVPGRVEILGKHTDYAAGSSLVAAIDRGICVVAVPRADRRVRVHALDLDEHVAFALDPELTVPRSHWSNYPMTVARRVSRNFPACHRGMDLALAADLPMAAGMSSSSALVVAVFLALARINRLSTSPAYRDNIANNLELAEYLGTVENGQSYRNLRGDLGVGTFGGSEDHTAILCSQSGSLGQFAYCPTRFERRIPLSENLRLTAAVSGLVAEKTGEAQVAYNRASKRVAELVDLWRSHGAGDQRYLADIIESAPDAAEQLRSFAVAGDSERGAGNTTAGRGDLAGRLQHFIAESAALTKAGDALLAADMPRFGEQVAHSQQLAEELLGNQVPETSYLAKAARASGAIASSAFGAGFGGSVWALAASDRCEEFLSRWSQAYGHRFPQHSERSLFLSLCPGPPAFELMREPL